MFYTPCKQIHLYDKDGCKFLQADFSARFVVASSSFDKSAGQHYAGFYQLQAGEPLRWVCQSNEIKYLVEGAHEVRDVKSGQTGIARAGTSSKFLRTTFFPLFKCFGEFGLHHLYWGICLTLLLPLPLVCLFSDDHRPVPCPGGPLTRDLWPQKQATPCFSRREAQSSTRQLVPAQRGSMWCKSRRRRVTRASCKNSRFSAAMETNGERCT